MLRVKTSISLSHPRQKSRRYAWLFWAWISAWMVTMPPLLKAQAMATAVAHPAIQRLNVQVMPEFDDPRVLVVVQGRLADDAGLPQTLSFRVPRGAQMNQMAIINMADGQPAARPFDLRDDSADNRWSIATYTVDNPHFFFEYYFNPLGANPQKQLTFTVSPLQSVADLVLEVQQPRTAEAFTTDPAADGQRTDTYGLTLHQFRVGALEVGTETAVTIQYTKTDSTPSVPRQNTTSPASVAGAGATISPWVFVLSAAAVVGGIAVFAWLRTRQLIVKPVSASAPNYCPHCGVRQRAGSQYCHACGAEL